MAPTSKGWESLTKWERFKIKAKTNLLYNWNPVYILYTKWQYKLIIGKALKSRLASIERKKILEDNK